MTAKDLFQAFLDKAGYKKIDELDLSMSITEYVVKEEDNTIAYSFDLYEYIFDTDGNFIIME